MKCFLIFTAFAIGCLPSLGQDERNFFQNFELFGSINYTTVNLPDHRNGFGYGVGIQKVLLSKRKHLNLISGLSLHYNTQYLNSIVFSPKESMRDAKASYFLATIPFSVRFIADEKTKFYMDLGPSIDIFRSGIFTGEKHAYHPQHGNIVTENSDVGMEIKRFNLGFHIGVYTSYLLKSKRLLTGVIWNYYIIQGYGDDILLSQFLQVRLGVRL